MRTARVQALAKLNLELRVIRKREDGYHELRSVFHTISLADTIEIACERARKTEITIEGAPGIRDNLMVRAAQLVLDGRKARVHFRVRKKIPMGAGLGGGSSDAAAVLIALPVLAGIRMEMPARIRLGARLGSDVPYFLLGGAAVALSRGTELYPLPDFPARHGVVAAPPVHVSTAEAYRALSPRLTSESEENKIVNFQSEIWVGLAAGRNDFEPVVFEQHPELASWRRRLARLGAKPAMMTGSGSALFGLFDTRAQATAAAKSLRLERVYRISLISRARYRSLWRRWLEPHVNPETTLWPPQSRYAR